MIEMSDLKLTIRRAVPDDASAYAVILGDESVFPGTLQLPYPTEAGWRERLTAKTNEGDIHLVAESNNEIVAHAMIFGNPQMRRRHACALGISVIGHAQGKGVGSALMKAMTDYADQWTTFLRIELTVFADNTNAIALYKKFGFEQEGLLRQYALRSGRFDDVITMARFNKNQAVVK
jgi:putative acetyltransferase